MKDNPFTSTLMIFSGDSFCNSGKISVERCQPPCHLLCSSLQSTSKREAEERLEEVE